jgi:hypothetical protein
MREVNFAMTDQEFSRLTSLLEEMRDNRKLQLARQAEALALQREPFTLIEKQHERAERIQVALSSSRSEALSSLPDRGRFWRSCCP